MEYSSLVNGGVASLLPYRMGKPLDVLQQELGVETLVRLNASECPYGVSTKVREVLDHAEEKLPFYPDSNAYHLKERLKTRYGYKINQIAVGAGSSQLVSLVCQAFLNPQLNVLIPQLSSVNLERCAQLTGAQIITTPIMDDWTPDLDALVDNFTTRTRMVLMSNPSNPLGAYCLQSKIADFMMRVPEDVIVVINEELVDFLGEGVADSYESIARFPNLVICRSLSHVHGLAGLRVGYMLASDEISGIINTLREPYNVSQLALDCAVAALSDLEFLKRVIKTTDVERNRFKQFCAYYGLSFIDTKTNSITIDFGEKAERYYQILLSLGILTRPLGYLGLPTLLNITLGNPYQNDFVLQKMERMVLSTNK